MAVDPKDPFKQIRESRKVLHARKQAALDKKREESPVDESDDSVVIVRTLTGRVKPPRKR